MNMYVVITTLGVNLLTSLKIVVHINLPICTKQYVQGYSLKQLLTKKVETIRKYLVGGELKNSKEIDYSSAFF